jgi:hypothetical protein
LWNGIYCSYTPLDFESTTTAYTFVDFDGGVVTKIANPDKTLILVLVKKKKQVKVRSKWHLQLTFQQLFKIKVWSPVAGKSFVKV